MKILCLGDSPYVKTGFGVVNHIATNALLAAGHELVVLGGQDYGARPDAPFTFVPSKENVADVMGWSQAPEVVREHKPDAVHIIGDATMLTMWLLHDEVANLPIVAYVPIEGAPLNIRWTHEWKTKPKAGLDIITCSNYGQKVLAESGFSSWMAYHGVSADFRPLDPEYVAVMRHAVGWDDKFVVMCVAQNVRRKQWPRLFEALKIVSKRHPNTMVYAHTVPFNNYWLGGWDLPQVAHSIGVWDKVQFAKHNKHNDAIGLRGLNEPGLVDLYNMADAFILPSQIEGFGLPLVEAMACGTPVAHTDIGAGAEVIGNAGIRIPVHDYEWFQGGQVYGNLDPRDIANAIDKMRNPEVNKQMRRKSLERARVFTWDAYEQTLKERFGAIEQSLREQDTQRPEAAA